jgi:hypothetical protein
VLTGSSLVICALYYWVWVYVLPKFGHYAIRQELLVLEDGATTHRLIKVPNEKLAAWEDSHDPLGRDLNSPPTEVVSEDDSHKESRDAKV